jgi:hypothetical protein
MARRDVPTDHDIVATFDSRRDAQRALRYLDSHGLRGNATLVEPGGDRLGRAARRALFAGLVGLAVGVALAWLWPGADGFEPDRAIRLGTIGFAAAGLLGAVTPDRVSERASETYVTVEREWALDARRMLHKRAAG